MRVTVSGGARPARALVLQHEAASPGGLILGWLGDRGIETGVARINARKGQR